MHLPFGLSKKNIDYNGVHACIINLVFEITNSRKKLLFLPFTEVPMPPIPLRRTAAAKVNLINYNQTQRRDTHDARVYSEFPGLDNRGKHS